MLPHQQSGKHKNRRVWEAKTVGIRGKHGPVPPQQQWDHVFFVSLLTALTHLGMSRAETGGTDPVWSAARHNLWVSFVQRQLWGNFLAFHPFFLSCLPRSVWQVNPCQVISWDTAHLPGSLGFFCALWLASVGCFIFAFGCLFYFILF